MKPTVWSAHRAFSVRLLTLTLSRLFFILIPIIVIINIIIIGIIIILYFFYLLNHSPALNVALHYCLPLLYVSF